MEHLINPMLEKMSADDLNQRYAESYVIYKGIPKYIYSFAGHIGKIVATIGNISTSDQPEPEQVNEVFKWDQLNVARPRAGWYVRKDGKGHATGIHLSYPPKRQWKRGLCQRNTLIKQEGFGVRSNGDLFDTILREHGWVGHPQKIADEHLEKGESVVLRPDRLLLFNGGEHQFFFRRTMLARIIPKDKALLFYQKGFEQELSEVSASKLLGSLKVDYIEPKVAIKPPRMVKVDGLWRVVDDLVPRAPERDDAPEEIEVQMDPPVDHLGLRSMAHERDWAQWERELIMNPGPVEAKYQEYRQRGPGASMKLHRLMFINPHPPANGGIVNAQAYLRIGRGKGVSFARYNESHEWFKMRPTYRMPLNGQWWKLSIWLWIGDLPDHQPYQEMAILIERE